MDWPYIAAISFWSIVLFLFVKYEVIGLCTWDSWLHPERLSVECHPETANA